MKLVPYVLVRILYKNLHRLCTDSHFREIVLSEVLRTRMYGRSGNTTDIKEKGSYESLHTKPQQS